MKCSLCVTGRRESMVAAQSQLEGITVFQVKGDGTLDEGDGRGGRKWVEISSVRNVTLLAK